MEILMEYYKQEGSSNAPPPWEKVSGADVH